MDWVFSSLISFSASIGRQSWRMGVKRISDQPIITLRQLRQAIALNYVDLRIVAEQLSFEPGRRLTKRPFWSVFGHTEPNIPSLGNSYSDQKWLNTAFYLSGVM
jgi:hypothetical protein